MTALWVDDLPTAKHPTACRIIKRKWFKIRYSHKHINLKRATNAKKLEKS